MVEYSPALAKRNEVPQPPRTVAPTISSISQVNPIFGLLVDRLEVAMILVVAEGDFQIEFADQR